MTLIEKKPRTGLRSLAVILAALYAGLILGVSFIATPAKFAAQSLSLAVGLDVGQAIFHGLAIAEWVLGGLLLIISLFARVTPLMLTFLGVVIVMRLLEDLWLLPVLDQRVAVVIAGGNNPASPHHGIYAAFDVSKFLLLLLFAWLGTRRAKTPISA